MNKPLRVSQNVSSIISFAWAQVDITIFGIKDHKGTMPGSVGIQGGSKALLWTAQA